MDTARLTEEILKLVNNRDYILKDILMDDRLHR